jgi:SPP1 family predicted phage head-tail adaptor
MRLGLKNRRIRFDKRVEYTDAEGGLYGWWEPVTTVWASIIPMRGVEKIQADQVAGKATHQFRVRYSSQLASITSANRVAIASRALLPEPVLVDGASGTADAAGDNVIIEYTPGTNFAQMGVRVLDIAEDVADGNFFEILQIASIALPTEPNPQPSGLGWYGRDYRVWTPHTPDRAFDIIEVKVHDETEINIRAIETT